MYLNASLASSTSNTYKSAWLKYVHFCRSTHAPVLPLQSSVLMFYVTWQARTLQYSTIKVYLASIQYYSNLFGYSQQVSEMQQLFYLLRGIRRVQRSRATTCKRPALSLPHLRRIINFIDLSFNYSDRLMLRSAVTLAFFGLLRSSEYCSFSHSSFSITNTLLVSDVSVRFSPFILSVFIKASKTDPFRQGCTIRIGAGFPPLCPVRSMIDFLNVHPTFTGPLFTFHNHSYLTRVFLSNLMQRALPDLPSINTHSFRIGGASAAAAAGIPDSTIQTLGRWSSDAFRRYLRLSDTTVSSITERMSSINDTRYFDTDTLRSN